MQFSINFQLKVNIICIKIVKQYFSITKKVKITFIIKQWNNYSVEI